MYNSNKLILLISFVLCILFVKSVVSDTDYAISPVSLLLPYSTSKFRKPYKLEANKGCFEWINTNPDLVEITPIYETAPAACDNQQQTIGIPDISLWDNSNLPSSNNKRCSKAVLVSVRSGGSSSERNSAFIYAEEQVTGKKLQCEVFVDRISSIVIETTTKTMYKDDLEELHVRAYDSVGNVFSSIIGLEFEWSITAGNIIQIVPFRGFPLDDVALKMEHDGLQTSFVLVQGVDTGRTQVTTKLTDNTYKDIQHSTTISILEPLQLNPSYLLYVISGTQIQYQLLTKKRTVLENIPLPNPNYIWSSSNSKVGKVDDSGNFMAMELGRTDLKVQHKNMSDNKVQALVNVVHPSYLAIKIEPLKSGYGPVGSSSWNLIEQRNYILTVELYDASAHKIHSSEITFDLNIPSEYFEPLPSNQIPSTSTKRSDTFYLKAIKQGTISLKASLIKVYDLNLKKYTALLNPISVEQEVTIHSQISLSPPIVYLPYLPKNKQTYTVRVNGGSGEYNWYTNNSAIVQVDSLGGISSQSSAGQTEVIVVDKKNPHNRDQVLVVVLTPDEITITPSRIEVQVGSTLQLSTKLLSKQLSKGIHFDSCNLNDLEWKVESSSGEQDKSFSILPVSSTTSKESLDLCSIREFLATKEGSSVATVYYNGMKASVRIFAYAPLKADHDEILLSLGSSANVFFRGGPDPWYLEPKSHFQTIVSNSTDQSAISIVPGNGNSFRVTCLQHTSSSSRTFITVTVGNKVSSSNPLPASPSISIPYSCSVPLSIQLQVANLPKETLDSISESSSSSSTTSSSSSSTTLPSCQDTIFSIKKQKPGEIGTYKIRNNRDIPFIAQVYDDLGKAFTNYSSLIFDWKSSDESQAKWLEDYNQIDHLSTLSLSKEQGKVIITSTIVGYDTELLKQLKVKQIPTLSNKISSSLELHLLSSVTLFPDSYTMYLSDKNHLKIEAIGGSKNFAFTSNSSKIASLAYQTGSDFVNVIPIQQGYLKVEVKDICLGSEPSSTTTSSTNAIAPTTTSPPSIIQISEVHSIELDVQDMVQVGDSIKLIVRGYAQNGQQFDESQYQYMNIIPHIDNPNVLSMIQSVDSQVFTLKGLDQGLVTLSVTIFNPKTSHSATSKTIQIQVFPPFRVSPSVLHLVPGGHFQIHWTGGAPIRQDVSFISSDNSIVNLSSGSSGSPSKQDLANGELVALKVGEATITVIAQIVDPISGKKMLIGQDKLMVYVKNMTGIRIHSSINKILVGNEAKLRVVGANGETPFTYGTVDLFFKWECLDSNIATLAPIYEGANTTVEIEGSFSVRVIGKNAGSTSITVWAYSGSDRTKYLFQAASLQINVIPDIPFQCTTSLLLPLNTASSFITNNHLDKSGIEFYPLSLDGHSSSSCKDVIDIGDNGKIVSLDKIGTCYVSAVRDGRMDTSKLMKINSKPFSHLELLPILPISSTVIPIGGSMSFSILLRDDIGEIFSEYGSLVVFSSEVSNTGIISSSIDGNVVTIKGIRAGLVTLHVYLKDMPHLDDYIKVFVGRLVEPHQPILHVGSTVHFSIAREQLEQRGYALPGNDEKVWATGDPSILSIDPVSGRAVAVGTGVTTVNYIRNPSSQTQVVVAKIGRVKVDFNDQVINSSAGEKYSYNLKFFTAPSTKGSTSEFEFTPQSNTINQNIKGECSIQESSFATARFEKVTSSNGKEQYYRCVVQPTGAATSTIEKVTLFVQVSNNDKSYVFESTVSLPFESTFSVLNVKSNKIQLSARQSTYVLNIQSSKPIFVESSDNSVLSVQQLNPEQQTENNIVKYAIQPMNPHVGFTSIPLYISSADGKSKTTINVSFSKSGSTTPINESTNNYVESSTINSHPFLFSFLIIATTLIIGLYISKQHNSQPRVYIAPNQNLQSSTPSGGIPSSPFRTPPPNSFSSPNRSTYGSSSIYLNNK